jgi:hypothetical protein
VIHVDDRIHQVFDRYQLTYYPAWPLDQLPVQRCSDEKYISDLQVLDYYRNLRPELITRRDYPNQVIRGMVEYGFWLATSMSVDGIQSPLNMYHWQNIHPGKKRYIVANYLQLDAVPVLVQHWPDQMLRPGGIPINTLDQLLEIYNHNVSINIRTKVDELLVECSWHGLTDLRDRNGYDDWYRSAAISVNEHNHLLDYLLQYGLYIQTDVAGIGINTGQLKITVNNDQSDKDFYIKLPEPSLLKYDLWQLYYHFDPRVGVKRCKVTGIEIVNRLGDPDWIIDGLNFKKTLHRPWLLDPERKHD